MNREIKVFYMGDDCHWYAGATRDEAVTAYLQDADRASEEFNPDEVVELTPSDLDAYCYQRETGEQVSGSEELRSMLARGVHFPCIFATTEY